MDVLMSINRDYVMLYGLLDAPNGVFVDSFDGAKFSTTKTLAWNSNAEGAIAFIKDHPEGRFVIGVRE
jgi:hypothetical protein